MADSELIVHTLPMVELNGATNVPTVVTYLKSRPIIGQEAQSAAREADMILNEDFKIDLGNYEPSAQRRKRFLTAMSVEKSAAELTGDFLTELISRTRNWLSFNGLDVAPAILLAEPLKDPNNPDWIRNYRSSIERILIGKGFEKSRVDFLPEPFAVFQYYRYGFRHPALADKRFHRALVLDFGGGTFDSCVVESKKDGDISQSGRNANPLAASSIPIGGFEINRLIAELVAIRIHKGTESKVRKAMDAYKKWRRTSEDLTSYSLEYSTFVLHFNKLVHDIEVSKIALSKNLFNWNLDANLTISVPVRAPKDMFLENSPIQTVHIGASEVRSLFVSRIWPRLKDNISNTLDKAKAELRGAPINVVLLSGGSCSFGWLRELITRDFLDELSSAQILTLPEYQEVVAKGLAIECARRFHTDRGDFGSVTYNRLCLTLDPDSHGQELPRYSPKFAPDRTNLPEGVLLPSSTALGQFVNTPLRWKFKLDRPPKQRLSYHFLRSSFDPNDISNLQNVEESFLATPSKTDFDSQLQVELTVGDEGTARPKFIYKTGRNGEDAITVNGRPFYLDMTNVSEGGSNAAYLGVDFGTSNSAVSYLSRASMEVLKARSNDSAWLTLQQLVLALPYPLARTLNRVMAGSASILSQDGIYRSLDFLESALALLGYTAYLELCTVKGNSSKLFKGFDKRSIGPLWGLVRNCLNNLGKDAQMLAPARKLLHPQNVAELDRIVFWFNQKKHNKAADYALDVVGALTFIGNVCNEVFSVSAFGFFEGVQKKRFNGGYAGRFRVAHGAVQPFGLYLEYQGKESFADYQPFVMNLEHHTALNLEPLGFWDHCPHHGASDEQHFYFLDSQRAGGFDFKAAGYDCTVRTEDQPSYLQLAKVLTDWKGKDPVLEMQHLDTVTEPE